MISADSLGIRRDSADTSEMFVRSRSASWCHLDGGRAVSSSWTDLFTPVTDGYWAELVVSW